METVYTIGYVYQIRCLKSPKLYIGSTVKPHEREMAHWRELRRGKHHSIGLQRAYDKYGRDSLFFEIVEQCSVEILLEREKAWIDAAGFNNTYNMARQPGSPMLGRQHSQASRQKMSDGRRGEKNGNYRGKSIQCPVCGMMFRPADSKRKYCSHECYCKAPRSEKTRQKISTAGKGRPRSKSSIAKGFRNRADWFLITDPDGNMQFIQGLAQFCRANGLDQGSMSKVSLGNAASYKGWKCKKL